LSRKKKWKVHAILAKTSKERPSEVAGPQWRCPEKTTKKGKGRGLKPKENTGKNNL